MNPILIDLFSDFASGMNFNQPIQQATQAGIQLVGNPTVIITAIILIAIGVAIFFFFKHIIGHVVFGGITWAIAIFFFHIELPLIPSFVIAIIFGPAGVGVMLALKFFGLLI